MAGASGSPERDPARQNAAVPGPAPPPAGFLIRPLRERARLTQQDVADKLGLDRKTYNKLECGRSDLTSPVACLLEVILGANPFELMAAQVRLDRWRLRAGQLERRAHGKGPPHDEHG